MYNIFHINTLSGKNIGQSRSELEAGVWERLEPYLAISSPARGRTPQSINIVSRSRYLPTYLLAPRSNRSPKVGGTEVFRLQFNTFGLLHGSLHQLQRLQPCEARCRGVFARCEYWVLFLHRFWYWLGMWCEVQGGRFEMPKGFRLGLFLHCWWEWFNAREGVELVTLLGLCIINVWFSICCLISHGGLEAAWSLPVFSKS